MFGNNTNRLARVERKQADLTMGLQMLAITLAAQDRGHRKPDLSKPIKLELRPLSQFVDTAVKDGLQRMFNANFFSICDFDALAKLAGVYVPKQLESHLRPLHCVHWNTMDPEYRAQIQQHIIACFVPVESPMNTPTSEHQ